MWETPANRKAWWHYMDEEIQKFIDYWNNKGVRLPDPEMYPKCFQYYIKLYKYYQSRAN